MNETSERAEQKYLLVLARKHARTGNIAKAKSLYYRAYKILPCADAQHRAFLRAMPSNLPLEAYYVEAEK